MSWGDGGPPPGSPLEMVGALVLIAIGVACLVAALAGAR